MEKADKKLYFGSTFGFNTDTDPALYLKPDPGNQIKRLHADPDPGQAYCHAKTCRFTLNIYIFSRFHNRLQNIDNYVGTKAIFKAREQVYLGFFFHCSWIRIGSRTPFTDPAQKGEEKIIAHPKGSKKHQLN
jgi:hypothetical protein